MWIGNCSGMSKKTGLFCFMKKLFFQDAHNQQQLEIDSFVMHNKCKRRRWFFARLKKTVKGLPSSEAEALRHKPAAATQVGRMSDPEVRESSIECERDEPICSTGVETCEEKICSLNALVYCHAEQWAAAKIQTSFRGYLAKKALRALKGFVTLQAIIRGQAVRRQAATTLKCLQSLVSIQSEICARRRQMSREMFSSDLLSLDVRPEEPKTVQTRLSVEGRSDCRLPSKDDEIDIILRKKEAILRLQKIKAYSFSPREFTDSEDGSTEGRRKYWPNLHIDDQLHLKHDKNEGTQLINGPRRSLQNQKKKIYTTEGLHPNCPTNLPTYMAATKSAKAKTRSVASPRLRAMHFDSFSDGDYSPYKRKFSPMTSVNSEVTSRGFSKGSNNDACHCRSQQKSPSSKGVSGPLGSSRIVDDVGL